MAYIERAYLTEQFENLLHDDNEMCPVMKVLDALEIIDTAPSADVYEEVHGHWIDTGKFDNFKTPIYQCSACINEVADNYINLHKYCLHCGAKMDGGKVNEN